MYKGFYKANTLEFSASCTVSGFQALNIISLISLYQIFINGKDHASLAKPILAIVILTLVIVNYIRYLWLRSHSYEEIDIKWSAKSKESRIVYKYVILVYAMLTILIPVGIIIFSTHRP